MVENLWNFEKLISMCRPSLDSGELGQTLDKRSLCRLIDFEFDFEVAIADDIQGKRMSK